MSGFKPGVHDGVTDADYHADPALSSSGARLLLPPSCPALFHWQRDNPPEPKAAFDLGHAAHAKILGAGMEVVVIDAADWKTKAAQEARKAAHADGKVPLLAADAEQVDAMAESILAHPIASVLFDPENGKPEQSLFWVDETTGVQCRARLDWLPEADDGRLIVSDLKSTISAEPSSIAKSVANFGYYQQADWYTTGVRALGIADDVPFVFVFIEKSPPYLVTVAELDADAMRIGRAQNRRALEVYAECSAVDEWPGYSNDVELISLPYWLTSRYQRTSA